MNIRSDTTLAHSAQDLTTLSLTDAAQAIRSQQITSVQLTLALLAKIEAHQGTNAMLFIDHTGALEAAHAADLAVLEGKPLGPLHGVPLVVKDNIHVAGMPNTAGTLALKQFVPTEDAAVVKALRSAGAIILGKTNMHELAFGITSNNAGFGAVNNAYNAGRFAGGSSGGSAVAVALGMAPAALGTDTGGSVRIPAALNGVVGFRPTVKRYSQEGITPLSSTRDTAGPMARSVADILLLDRVISGSSSTPPIAQLNGLRLGVYRSYFFRNLDPDTATHTEAALDVLRASGVEIVEVDIPNLDELNQKVSFPVVLFEGKRDLSRYLSQYQVGLSLEQVAAEIASPDVKVVFDSAMLGDQAIPETVYRAALDVYRPQLQSAYHEAFGKYRVAALIFPTTHCQLRRFQAPTTL
jgi:indoleacetamide hydrolase